MNWLRNLIDNAMNEMHVPGAAVAVIKDNEIIYAQGHGLRNVEDKLEVTTDTIFPIASITKSFTSALASIALQEKGLTWDTKVSEIMPEFELNDKDLNRIVTLKDLGSHRTGMMRHDLMGFNFLGERDEFVKRIKHLKIYAGFREEARYQNQVFATLGYIPDKVWGKEWETMVFEKLLNPLEMNRSVIELDDMLNDSDHMTPYGYRNEKLYKIDYKTELHKASAPAGRLKCSIIDMANYTMMMLNKGNFKGEQIVSEENIKQLHSPHAISNILPFTSFKEFGTSHYGLGWFIDDYRGYRMVSHGGNGYGWTSLVTMIPEENLGIVTLTNMDHTTLTYVLANAIIDKMLNLEEINWINRFNDLMSKASKKSNSYNEMLLNKAIKNTNSRDLDDFVGTYTEKGYGELKIINKSGKLFLCYHPFEFELKHYHYNTFVLYFDEADIYMRVKFEDNFNGEINKLVWELPESEGGILYFDRKN